MRLWAVPNVRLVLRSALILVGMGVAGLLGLLAVDSTVPMARIGARLTTAEAEGRFGPGGKQVRAGVELNAFSDCMALSTALAWDGRQPAFSVRSPALLWTPGEDLCADAANASHRSAAWFDYGRYWHGYRVILFPLYALLPLQGVQAVMLLVLLCAITGLAVAVARVAGWAAALTLHLGLLLSAGIAPTYALPTHAVSLGVLLGGTALLIALPRGASLVLPGLVLGAAYNYVDFFYNPAALAVLVGGASVLRDLDRRSAASPTLESALAAAAALAGYLGFWAVKWGLGLLILGTPGGQALVGGGDFSRWIAGGSAPYHPLEATLAALRTAALVPIVLPVWAVLAVVTAAGLLHRRSRRALGAMVLPVLLATLTLEAAAGHTLAHRGFTGRTIPIAFSVLAMLAVAGLTATSRRASAQLSEGL